MGRFFCSQTSEGAIKKETRNIILLYGMVFIIYAFAYQSFIVPTGSMKPTILEGDCLIVSKSAYGYSKYSLPFDLPIIQGRIKYNTKPKRGEIVVFRNPKNLRMDYIKRCVGLPGDRIEVRKGILYINGKSCTYKRIADHVEKYYETNKRQRELAQICDIDAEKKEIRIHKYLEKFPDSDCEHEILSILDNEINRLCNIRNNFPEFIVPANHYFMMGDNRHNSIDSCVIGPIHEDYILGKAFFVCCSVDFKFDGELKKPWTWEMRLMPRWNRFGMVMK